MRITRVTLTEFETEDGSVFPIDPPLIEELTVEEFQEHYDFATQVVRGSRNARSDNTNSTELE